MKTDLEENFNKALNLCEAELSHVGLIELLRAGDVAERQFAALSLDGVETQEEAEILISNLTGCDGKIREAVGSRLDEFLRGETAKFFLPYYEIFADATIDINANISRFVIDAIRVFINNDEFGTKYANILMRFLEEAFEEISKIKFRDKKYVLNKQLFKMYWALEGLKNFFVYVDEQQLYSVLKQVLDRPEYTIREKAAEILVKFRDNASFVGLLQEVSQDENFYVRRVLNDLKEI